MKLKKTQLLLISLLGSFVFTTISAEASSSETAKYAIETAEKARLEAKARGFEWSTTSILIEKATQASANGNEKDAVEFANKALKEAENAIVQADYADKNWKKFAL